jgi:hypothetical protein
MRSWLSPVNVGKLDKKAMRATYGGIYRQAT